MASPPRPERVDEIGAEHRRGARRIAIGYAAVGALWILFSDRVLERMVGDAALRGEVQSVKGALYVVVTAAVLYVLVARHRARIAARDRRLRAVIDAIVDAVVVCEQSGRVVDANAAAVRLFGDVVRGGGIPEVLASCRARHADGRPLEAHDSAARRALAGETVTGLEVILRAADGQDHAMSVAAAPILLPSGAPELAVMALRDVSEGKRLEEAREEFLATAAHELKTPLAVVKAHAQLMLKRGQGDAEALSAIARQVDRLHRIVQQLLESSRLRAGLGELRRERFDLGELAEEVLAAMQTAQGRVVLAREPATAVMGDRERIGQVVGALLENALRFSPGGGRVEASISRADGEAVVSVRDRGVGIPPERQARVFERYYRAHAGTASDYGGLGLGLGVSRDIVIRHGGRMWFDSAPGRGSTFSFSLPLAPAGERR